MTRRAIRWKDFATNRLEIGDDNRLYWDGELIMTSVRLSLPWWVNIAAIIAALSTFGIFLLGTFQAAGLIPPPVPQVYITNVIGGDALKAPSIDKQTSSRARAAGSNETQTRQGTSEDVSD